MLQKLKAGLMGLVDPTSSEFWALIVTVAGYVLVRAGIVDEELWKQWAPGILVYITGRFTSKTVKA